MKFSNLKFFSCYLGIVIAGVLTILSSDGHALGDVAPFHGAKMAGRAGVGAAMSEDATSGSLNPALMANIGNVFSLHPFIAFENQALDYLVPSLPPFPGFAGVDVRALGPQKSRDDVLPGIFGGFNYQLNCNWSFGQTLTSIATFTKYDNNFVIPLDTAPDFILSDILGSGQGNTYAQEISPQLNNILAYKVNDQQAYAVSLILGYKERKTDFLNPITGEPTQFSGTLARSFGIGTKVGAHWRVHPNLELGLAVGTPIFFQKLKEYREIVPHNPNQAWNGVIGFAWHVNPKMTLGFDMEGRLTKYVKALGKPPPDGLGWTNAFNYKVSAQYKCLCTLICRVGYNYGASPIKDSAVFANGLDATPAITAHMIGAGFTYTLDEKMDIDFAGNYFFKNTLMDNGQHTLENISKGMRLSGELMTFMLGFNYKF